ncbi:MAG: AAA family ATPase [Candidatus Anstonellales archaeon]
MRILITGCPGTGKTSISKSLIKGLKRLGKAQKAQRKAKRKKLSVNKKDLIKPTLLEINKIADDFGLYEFFDDSLESKVVNIKSLENILNEVLEIEEEKFNYIIIEGHLGVEIKIRKVDYVFVLRTNPLELEKRLEKRGYTKRKISENINAELVDYFTIKAEKLYGRNKVFEVDTTTNNASENAKKILEVVLGKKTKKERKRISWSFIFERNLDFVVRHNKV